MALLDTLNEPQQRAVQLAGGPALVLAGPGSGKTRVLTHRVAYLISELHVDPYNILAVTFTNKAAKEMRERLTVLIGPDRTQRLTVGTFHSICARWLRIELPSPPAENAPGLYRNFTIYDDDDQQRLMRRVIKSLSLDEKQYAPRAILSAISKAKNELVGPQEFARMTQTHREDMFARCYEHYQELLNESNAVDFDDLLLVSLRLLQRQPQLLEKYQHRFQHVLIDEYQDVNSCQYEWAKLLSGKHRNLFAVGDEDQSVYAFRGADMRYVLQFEDDFPDAQVILLEQNYRSTQSILDVATALIKGSGKRKHAKQLWTHNNRGVLVSLQEAYTEEEEAVIVVDEIERLLQKGKHKLQDIAVLYRTNAQSRVIEEVFLRRALRYRLVGGTRFYERKEIKDVLAYLRLINNPFDSVSFDRILETQPGIGRQTIAQLGDWASDLGVPAYTALQLLDPQAVDANELQPQTANRFTGRVRTLLVSFLHLLDDLIKGKAEVGLIQLLDLVLERTAFHDALIREYGDEEAETRWENVLELRTVAAQYQHYVPEAQLPTFLEEAALISATDDLLVEQDAATLMTMHQAKGLEFPVVFAVGLEEGIMPHNRSLEDVEQLEEERRLLYVAATRAMERLYLLHAFKRTLYGRSNIAIPSRFLADVPETLLKKSRERSDRVASQTTMFTGRASFGGAGRGNGAAWGNHGKKNTTPLKPSPTAEFTAGTKVRHSTFGEGIVVSSEAKGDDEEVTVAFVGKGIKKLLAAFAKLEKV